MSHEPIPVAVVGTGSMGSNHVRVFDQLAEANLVEIVEADPGRAEAISERYNVEIVDDVCDLLHARAATIAVPNTHHRQVAIDAIESGLDVLVEKPLAPSIDDADAILDVAASHDAVLQVGHVERFNPAIETLTDIIDRLDVIALEAHRLGPYTEHLTDESVVFDLMIHDIDIIDSLISEPVDYVSAIGTHTRSDKLDHAIAHLKYTNGVLGTATASHVTHGKTRRLTVTTREAYIELDYQSQQINVHRHGQRGSSALIEDTGYDVNTVIETPLVVTQEPLQRELSHFLHCVRTRDSPKVAGQDGRRAVDRAAHIMEIIDSK